MLNSIVPALTAALSDGEKNCEPLRLKKHDKKTEEMSGRRNYMTEKVQTFDTEYDLIVVGSGGSGKITALTAAKAAYGSLSWRKGK